MKNHVLAALAVTAMGLAGCQVGVYPVLSARGAQAMRPAAHQAGQAKWTLLVHMAADNNLDSFAPVDLNQMEAGLNSPEVNVIVLFDGFKVGDSCLYRITHDVAMNGQIVSEKIDDAGAVIDPSTHEIDSGDPQTAARFARWAVKQFPADRYGMSFWDHGSGLFDEGLRPPSGRSFCHDVRGGLMQSSDLTPILAAGAQAAGQPFEVLGFDACLMSHVEMAYQAKGLANYMIASEETIPGAGWDYLTTLQTLSAHPDMDGAGYGQAAVEAFVNSYRPGGSQNPTHRYLYATLACTSIPRVVTKLTPALNDFARVAMAGYAANKPALDAARLESNHFYNGDCVDLGDFLKELAKSPVSADLKAAGAAVEAARSAAVIACGGVGEPEHVASTGLVVYFPSTLQPYDPVYSDPAKIAFAAEDWKNYLLLIQSQKPR